MRLTTRLSDDNKVSDVIVANYNNLEVHWCYNLFLKKCINTTCSDKPCNHHEWISIKRWKVQSIWHNEKKKYRSSESREANIIFFVDILRIWSSILLMFLTFNSRTLRYIIHDVLVQYLISHFFWNELRFDEYSDKKSIMVSRRVSSSVYVRCVSSSSSLVSFCNDWNSVLTREKHKKKKRQEHRFWFKKILSISDTSISYVQKSKENDTKRVSRSIKRWVYLLM
jgi:hypothetical protein